MWLSLFRHELRLTVRNRKNIILLLFLTVFLCMYVFILLPNEKTSETLPYEEISHELKVLKQVQEKREERRATGVSPMSHRNYYADSKFYIDLFEAMIHAIDKGDFKRYAFLRAHYHYGVKKDYIEKDELLPDSPFPVKDLLHSTEKHLLTYQYLLQSSIPITYEVIEEKTALQVVSKHFHNFAPYILVFLAIYFSNDILTRDRRQKTVLKGLPISWYQYLNIKSLASYFYVSVVTIFLVLMTVICISILNGFGSFDMKLPALGERIDNVNYGYILIPIGKYMLFGFAFLFLFYFIFVRLTLMLSLIFKNEWVILILTTLILFTEKFYYARDKRELFGKDVSFFPQTYLDIGKVITGEKNYLLNIDTVSYNKGLIILLLCWLLVEILLYVVSKFANRRWFYQ